MRVRAGCDAPRAAWAVRPPRGCKKRTYKLDLPMVAWWWTGGPTGGEPWVLLGRAAGGAGAGLPPGAAHAPAYGLLSVQYKSLYTVEIPVLGCTVERSP